MSMTAVPISIRLVRAPTAASSGNGDPSCRAKWCTRKYAPSAPSSSAATARSTDCSSASDADRVSEPGDDDQCPNDKKPILFTSASTRTAQAAFLRQMRTRRPVWRRVVMGLSVVSPVFIGRREEMTALAGVLRRTQGGEPAVALVGGEAGVGKTRLVGELAGVASAAGLRVLAGQCIQLGGEELPLAPLVDALRALARVAPAGELEELLGPGLTRLLPEFASAAATV